MNAVKRRGRVVLRKTKSPNKHKTDKVKLKKGGLEAKLKARNRAKPNKRKAFKNNELLSSAFARQGLIELAGENAVNVLREFSFEMSDEDLARKSKTKLSDVRAVLNRLHTTGLVDYARSRDPESGWYSYVWRINDTTVEKMIESYKLKNAQNTENTVVGGEVYYCKECGEGTKDSFEEAYDKKFKCLGCRKDLVLFE
ncbi:hypothetical protein FJZ26_01540 [Candidatus Parvarchaeota archaeon]|nr:hypothetical protein [Candidatus Parvarchaeota archaeon]